jgi:hypothetical protein
MLASVLVIFSSRRALDALDRIKDSNGSPRLFPGERGGHLDIHHFRPFQWRPAQKAAGAEVRPRRFRRPKRHFLPFHVEPILLG